MSTIRRQSIISSGVVYFGFGIGAVINFLLLREFNPDQYGLVSGMFTAIGTIMFGFANLGSITYIYKFYPYYQDNLAPRKNDLLTRALIFSLIGFLFVGIAGVVFEKQIVHFYQDKSSELVRYYYWLFPFGLGLTIYSVLEVYAWQAKRSILTNFLREVLLRLTTLFLILLYLLNAIHGFGTFVRLFAFNYLLIACVLAACLIRAGQLHLVFTRSIVTRKFFRKIRSLRLLAWTGNVIFNLSFFFAQIVIASVVPGGLVAVGIFTMAQYAGSLVQAPNRAIQAASIGPLSRAWKDKDYGRIVRIYQRSSISQLVFSVGIFSLLLLNFTDGIITFHFKPEYLGARVVFILIGLARIVDMGTGVNNQIIQTSTFWRFDLFSGFVLVFLTLPLNYVLAKKMGVVGPAIADLITFAVYNGIRCVFLYRKFNKMQPFTPQSLYTLLLGAACFALCFIAFNQFQGILWLFVRSICFLGLYGAGVVTLKLSEDVMPVWETIKKRLGLTNR